MKILIDIDDYDREWIVNSYHIPDEINRKIAKAIIDGAPLPEHGRLIDKDKMMADLLTVDPQYQVLIDWCLQVTEAQPTIIEGE